MRQSLENTNRHLTHLSANDTIPRLNSQPQITIMGLFDKLKRNKPQEKPKGKSNSIFAGLRKTRQILTADLGDLFSGRKKIDDDVLDELETRLLTADVGIEASEQILDDLRKRISYGEIEDVDALLKQLAEILIKHLPTASEPQQDTQEQQAPHSILVVGVNGSGKTTTIGKLSKHFQQAGMSVMLAAGDTFRAAAVEQLQTWGERNKVPVIAQGSGADSAAVVFDALQSAQAKQIDVLLADTAGRLHTQSGLMDELKKVKRVLAKLDPDAPNETLLVLDASIGQNALQQAKQFHEAIGITGLVLTKLDGTAKGGIVFAIQQQLDIPVRFIGVGEGIDDLRPFDAAEFVHALLTLD